MAPSQPPSSLATIFGANLQRARAAANLTQYQLARLIDADSQQVSKWERGKHRPSDQYLHALCRELDRDVAWFYSEHAEQRRRAA